ncbi:MAG: pentapeptide repeat-containing protein, partial [Phycisphaerales bacterium]
MNLFAFSAITIVCTNIATADIYQWIDGDRDGSLWLSASLPEPFSNISRQTLWWAELENINLTNSNLSASNISFAHLAKTNLQNADLSFTLFVGAELRATNLSNA